MPYPLSGNNRVPHYFRVYPRSDFSNKIKRAADQRPNFEPLPALECVYKLGVGLDEIPPAATHKHGVRLGWTPGVDKRSIAEIALCLALAHCADSSDSTP